MTAEHDAHPYAAAARAADTRTGGLASRLARTAREQADGPDDARAALAAALVIAIEMAEPADDDLPDPLALAALDGIDLLRRADWWRRGDATERTKS